MKIIINHLRTKGHVKAELLSKGVSFYKKEKIEDEEEIEIPDEKNTYLTLELTYFSPEVSTKKDRWHYYWELLWCHLFFFYKKDPDIYSIRSHPAIKRTFQLDNLKNDIIFDYAPYLESAVRADGDEIEKGLAIYPEEERYPYHFINILVLIDELIILGLMIGFIIYANYMWIKTL